MTSKVNKHNIRFPRDEEGNIDVKMVNMTRTINRKSAPSSMNKKEGYASVQPILKVRMGQYQANNVKFLIIQVKIL